MEQGGREHQPDEGKGAATARWQLPAEQGPSPTFVPRNLANEEIPEIFDRLTQIMPIFKKYKNHMNFLDIPYGCFSI